MVSRVELAEQFSNFGIELADDVLEKCWEVCVEAGVGEEEFLETWMAYSVSRLGGADPTIELLAQMERDEYGKRSGIHNRNTPSTPATRGKKGGGDLIIYDPSSRNTQSSKFDADLLETYGSTPKVTRRGNAGKVLGAEVTPSPGQYNALKEKSSQGAVPPRGTFSPASYSPSTATPSVAYSGRSNAGQVVCSVNASEVAEWEWEGGLPSFRPSVVELNGRPSGAGGTLRYMCDFVGEVAELLEGQLHVMGKYLNEAGGLEPWVPEPLDMPQRSSQNYLGRICGDGRLNAESILLEGAVDSTVSGKPIRLDVSRMPCSEEGTPKEPYALFPGQVVVVSGQNHKGQRLYAQQVYSKASAPLPSNAPSLSTGTGPLHVMVGTGPFTQRDTLSYEPLQDLVAQVHKLQPHVLILIGPFLEFAHTHISGDGGCQLAESFENYLDRMVDEMMGQLQGLTTQVVLVSSARDVNAHPVYPTPAYAFPKGGRTLQYMGGDGKTKQPRLIVAPDPCLLDISGVVIGVTATDILMHLGREEMAGAGHKVDRLGRLSRHLIHQRNFYPLYPPALGVNMDLKLWSQMCALPVTPHILILPSDLRGFIKDVDGCIVMNPERLTKGVVGGSYAKFEVQPPSTGAWEPSLLSHVRAQIVKI
ncbi:DNA polymerase alpha subunit B isoform X2 [Hetaerina americana]|uniref:DNA polymerase alpha subunit B isoform X2 n=1 Tax=Hetaerina americana TaxID=62018 RepID=UPI003A7F5518